MFAMLTPPYFFAHRGASAHAPENTLAAFRLAREQGAPAIEFDVKLSADGQVVIHHDPTLERTTNGRGPLSRYTLRELKQLDAGAWFGDSFRGETIPTLEEVFAALGGQIFMNIELTNYASPLDALVPRVAELIKKYDLQESVMFSSFFPHNLMRAGRLLPQVARGQLSLPGGAGGWQRLWGGLLALQADHPFEGDVRPAGVEQSHRRGRRVHVWTVNEPQAMRRLWQIGVDGIFTDDPLTARSVLQSL
ncbi:MAG: glycerophosphodiester phosphodiesterase [Anaerolineales bacterium]